MIESLGISVAINALMFIVAFLKKTDKLTDLSYSLTFIAITIFSILTNNLSVVKLTAAAIVLLWAFRLGSYLLYRIKIMGRDKRFDDKRNSFVRFGGFWALQAITAWIVMLPVTLLFGAVSADEITPLVAFGVAISVFGIFFETVADLQKFIFIQDKKNKGKWIETGLWKYSRHPNYFGEILVWSGIYLITLEYLTRTDLLLSAVSPLFITVMLVFVSGIPLLEKSADKKWSRNAKYRKYKEETSILVPMPKAR